MRLEGHFLHIKFNRREKSAVAKPCFHTNNNISKENYKYQ